METLDFGAIGNLSPDALLHHPGIIGAVAEHAATALLLTDIHDHCIYMNPAAEQMTGFRFAELKGQALHRTLHYKQPGSPVHQTCRCAVYQAIKKKTALRNQEEVLIRKNKTACRVQYSITPIFDAQQVVAFLYEIQDVHAKPLQEQALKNLEELIDTTSLLVTAWDSSARLTYASRAWLEYTGVPWEQFRKTGLMEHFHPDIREAAVAEWRNAFAQRRCFSGEYLVRSVSGEYRWFYFVAAPRFTAEGEFLGFYATAFDIHDRKLAETPRPESEIRFKRLFNNSLVGLFFWEFSGDITEANDSFLDLLGYTRQEFEEKGLNWRSITPPELIYLDQEALRHLQVASSTEPYEKQFIHRDGHPIDVLVQASLLGDGLNQGLMVVRELKQHRKKRSKQPLQESEQWSRAVADTTPILLWTADPDGHCTYVNRAWEEFTGKTEAELLGSGWLKVFHKQDFKWRIEAGKEPHRFQKEVRLRHQDGRYRWAVLSATPKFNKRGDCTGYTGAIVDINAQKEASLELERSANYFREITEHSLLMLWLSDEKGYVTFVSQGLANFCGLDKEELLGHQWLKCIHPDDREVCFFKYQSQTPTREEERIRHRDGKYRWVLIVTHPRYDAKGNFIGFIGLMTDIEDRKQMEFALKNSEAHFRRLLDASPLMLWMTNANQEVYFLSQGLADYAGTNKDAFMNSGWQFVLHPDDAEHYKNTVQTHHANHTPFREEVRHIYRDGTYRWVFVTGHPMFGPSGEFIGFFGTITDIEDRKRIELALKKSEEYFRYIVDTSPVMLWIGSQEGYEFVSAGLSEYFGLPKEAFNEMSWLDMFHPDDQEALRLAYLKGYETQEPYTIEARARTKDGTYRWILNSGRPRFDADGKFAGLIGLIMDIHDRKEAILSLQRSEEYFRYIVDTSPVMLWMCSADGDNEFVSTSLAEYFGLPKKAFTGLRWMELIHPDDRKAFVEQYEKTRDTQQPYAIEARAKVASGEYRWILSSARPRFDTDGKFTGLIGLILDIHDQKESILALQRSEEYFRYIVDIAPVML
ncbi:MAG TPA: PAS domain S-box protein, partial [Oculatellaceae cyanobacterium]